MRCKDHEFDKPKSDILGAISEHVKILNCPSGSKLCNVSIMRAKCFSEHCISSTTNSNCCLSLLKFDIDIPLYCTVFEAAMKWTAGQMKMIFAGVYQDA